MLVKVGRIFQSRQTNSGAEAVQVGAVHGDLTIVHVRTEQRPENENAEVLKQQQRQVLRLLNGVHDRHGVLEFMRREFGTSMVKELRFPQLYRVRKYIEAVLRRQAQSALASESRKETNEEV